MLKKMLTVSVVGLSCAACSNHGWQNREGEEPGEQSAPLVGGTPVSAVDTGAVNIVLPGFSNVGSGG